MSEAAGLVLHGYWRSGTSYRTRIALNFKNLAYRQVTHDLREGEQRDPAYLALNAQGLMPSLETPDGVLTQSPAIIEWLEETFPEPPLLPSSAHDRAIVRSMAAVIACDIHPLNNLRVLQALRNDLAASEEDVASWISRWITDGFVALESMIGQFGGDFCFGDGLTVADCHLVPQVYSAERFNVDLAGFPNILQVSRNASQIQAVAAAHPDKQPGAPGQQG